MELDKLRTRIKEISEIVETGGGRSPRSISGASVNYVMSGKGGTCSWIRQENRISSLNEATKQSEGIKGKSIWDLAEIKTQLGLNPKLFRFAN